VVYPPTGSTANVWEMSTSPKPHWGTAPIPLPTLTDKKSRTFQDPREGFSTTFSEPKVSNSQHKLGAILLLLVFFYLNHYKNA